MSEITVLFKIKEEPIKEKINEELNWYDTIKKKMIVLYGGKLSFEYKKDEYLVKMGEEERQKRGIKSVFRMLPKAIDVEVKNYNKIEKITNKKEIENWFFSSSYVNDIFVEDINNEGIVFDVPDKEVDDFCYQLERQSFNFRT